MRPVGALHHIFQLHLTQPEKFTWRRDSNTTAVSLLLPPITRPDPSQQYSIAHMVRFIDK